MARRVFLHIGTMKSGTSYLQDLCDHNRDRLSADGLLWTKSAENFLATDDLLGTQRVRPGLEGAWQRLDQEIRAFDGDALVSNELLAPIPPPQRTRLVDAVAPAEPHVVVTARDLGRVIPSQWQTRARTRQTARWMDFVDAICSDDESDLATAFWRRQDVAAMVERWQRNVPVERISVVTVPASGGDPAVMGERFATALGVRGDGFEQPPYSNPSVGAHSAELLRRLNERTADFDWLHYRWAFKNALSRVVLAQRASQEPPIALTQAQLDQVSKRSHRMVEELAATGVRVVGDLRDLVPASVAKGGAVDPGETTTPDLLETAFDGLVGMGHVLGDVRIEHDLLIRQVDAFLGGEGEHAAEFAEFHAYEASLPEPPPQQMVHSRFLRWRLDRMTRRHVS